MQILRAVLAVGLCLGLLPMADLLSAAQTAEHQCSHGHTDCKCPEQCDRPAPKPEEAMAGMACHRAPQADAPPPEPSGPVDGPCWRSCSSQDEVAQAAAQAYYLSAGDLVASGPFVQAQSAITLAGHKPTTPNFLPPSPPPRNS